MALQPGDVVIVVKANGQVCYWAQDTPEVLAYLGSVRELSLCQCQQAHDDDDSTCWPLPMAICDTRKRRQALADGQY